MTTKRRVASLLKLVGVLALGACTPGLYLSESEVAIYRSTLATEQSANEFARALAGERIEVQFVRQVTAAGARTHVRQSTILDVLRRTSLVMPEQLFRQIRLDRLSTQIDEALGRWVDGQLSLLELAADSRVQISPERGTLDILAAPTLTYRPGHQTVTLDLRIRVGLEGMLYLRVLDPAWGTFFGGIVPTWQSHPISLSVDDLRLRAEIGFEDAARVGSRVRLDASLTPAPRAIAISGLPGPLVDPVRTLAQRKFSATIHEEHALAFDYFGLTGVRLSPQGELQATYQDRPEKAVPILDLVVQGAGFRLYHARGTGRDWTAFRPVPFPAGFAGPPALVSAAPGTLELGAVASTGQFRYAGWRHGQWWNLYQSPERMFTGSRPAMVASAPGQIEVVLLGSDGRLYHLRRMNNVWQRARRIEHPSLQQVSLAFPTAVQVGNLVVLTFGTSSGRSAVMVFDLDSQTWSAPTELQGPGPARSPAIASCGYARVDVVYVAADGGVYHQELIAVQSVAGPRTFGVMPVGSVRRLEGRLTGPPALTCSGFERLELVGRGPAGRVLHARYVRDVGFWEGRSIRPGWQPWEDAGGQFAGTPSLFGAAIGSTIPPEIGSTRSGDVYVVALTSGPRPQLIDNRLLSWRFGRAPVKTVHWRGFRRFGGNGPYASTALAVTDTEFEIATRGRDDALWHASLGEPHRARFAGLGRVLIGFPFDPVVLASGPGMVELLFPGEDGHVQHVSWLNGTAYRFRAVPPPPNTRIDSPVAAATVGPGQIEVVAVGRDRALYHWRFIRGGWSQQPTRVGGPVVSAPVLISTGSGQLELFAVGEDLRVHRWRFRGVDPGTGRMLARWVAYGPLANSPPVSGATFSGNWASSFGEGAVDVVLVDARTGDALHSRIHGTDSISTPHVWTLIQGRVRDLIVSALWTDRVHVVIQDAYDGQIVARRLGTSVLERLFGPPDRALLLGGALSTGDRQLAVVAADPRDGRLYLSRYLGWQWSQFLPIDDNERNRFRLPTKPAIGH